MGMIVLDADLEGFDVEFADGLLIGPSEKVFSVGFLFVDGEVLQVGDHALLVAALDDVAGHLAGEIGIFRIVFEVSAAEGRTMEIDARGIQAGDNRRTVSEEALVSDEEAFLVGEALVPSGGKDGLAGEVGVGSAHISTRQSGRSIFLMGRGEAKFVDAIDVPSGVPEGVGHASLGLASDGKLVQIVLPERIVIGKTVEIFQHDGAGIVSDSRHFLGIPRIAGIVVGEDFFA